MQNIIIGCQGDPTPVLLTTIHSHFKDSHYWKEATELWENKYTIWIQLRDQVRSMDND